MLFTQENSWVKNEENTVNIKYDMRLSCQVYFMLFTSSPYCSETLHCLFSITYYIEYDWKGTQRYVKINFIRSTTINLIIIVHFTYLFDTTQLARRVSSLNVSLSLYRENYFHFSELFILNHSRLFGLCQLWWNKEFSIVVGLMQGWVARSNTKTRATAIVSIYCQKRMNSSRI